MKKTISILAAVVLAKYSFADSDLVNAFKDGKTSGQIRSMYIKTDNKSPILDTSAFAVGGKLAYETAPFYGISGGLAFYTSQDFGTKNEDINKVDESLYDENKNSYTILGQAYLLGQFGKTTVKVGRQQIDTPLAGSDDARMIPNLFEAALITNTDLTDTTLIAGYISKMAGWDSLSDKSSRTKFQSMSRSVLGSRVDEQVGDKGVYVVAAINNSIKDLTFQAWEYRAVDVVNALYLQADYKLDLAKDIALDLAAQYYNMIGIGKTKDLLNDANEGLSLIHI